MPAPSDAPDRVWSVRQCVGGGNRYPTYQHRAYQPVTYVREFRKRDRFYVWKLDTPLTDEHFPDRLTAITAGRAEGMRHGVTQCDVNLYDLALRLSDLFPDQAERARVRLGEGWRFILASKKSITARRGPVYSTAICTHDRKSKSSAPFGARDIVEFQRLCGRVNEAQYQQLVKFADAYGVPELRVDTLPHKPGTRIHPRAYSYVGNED